MAWFEKTYPFTFGKLARGEFLDRMRDNVTTSNGEVRVDAMREIHRDFMDPQNRALLKTSKVLLDEMLTRRDDSGKLHEGIIDSTLRYMHERLNLRKAPPTEDELDYLANAKADARVLITQLVTPELDLRVEGNYLSLTQDNKQIGYARIDPKKFDLEACQIRINGKTFYSPKSEDGADEHWTDKVKRMQGGPRLRVFDDTNEASLPPPQVLDLISDGNTLTVNYAGKPMMQARTKPENLGLDHATISVDNKVIQLGKSDHIALEACSRDWGRKISLYTGPDDAVVRGA